MERKPTPPESSKKRGQDSSTECINRSSMLPSMSSQDSDPRGDSLRPASQAGQLPYAHLPSQSQPPPGLVQPQTTCTKIDQCAQTDGTDAEDISSPLGQPPHSAAASPPPGLAQPQATYAQIDQSTQTDGTGAGGISPPSGHPPQSAAASPLPPPAAPTLDPSAAEFPPRQAYHSAATQGPRTYPGSDPPAAFMRPSGMMPPATGMMPPPGIPHGQYPSCATPVYESITQAYSYGMNPPPPFPLAASQTGYASPIPGPAHGLARGAYPDFWNDYPRQHRVGANYGSGAPAGFGGEPPRRGRQGRSYAIHPGKSYNYSKGRRCGPSGANLFVFHIPNDMTNHEMLHIFRPYGTVLSVRIETEKRTGRGVGYGFVSYDNAESAAEAIHFLNGYVIRGKRLKVQHKRVENEARGQETHRDRSRPGPSTAPAQQPAAPRAQQHETRPSYPYQQSRPRDEAHESAFVHVPSSCFVPVQERRGSTPVLPPIEALGGEGPGDRQDAESDITSSPLADLKEVGDALPDLPE